MIKLGNITQTEYTNEIDMDIVMNKTTENNIKEFLDGYYQLCKKYELETSAEIGGSHVIYKFDASTKGFGFE